MLHEFLDKYSCKSGFGPSFLLLILCLKILIFVPNLYKSKFMIRIKNYVVCYVIMSVREKFHNQNMIIPGCTGSNEISFSFIWPECWLPCSKSTPLDCTLCYFRAFHIFTPYLSKVFLNIILPSVPTTHSWFYNYNLYAYFVFPPLQCVLRCLSEVIAQYWVRNTNCEARHYVIFSISL